MSIEVAVLASLLEVTSSTEVVSAIGVVVIIALIGLSAFFSSSEIAMFSLAQHRLDTLVSEGHTGAKQVKDLKDDPHRLLITILVGNNLVNIAMSSIATGILAFYVTQGQAIAIATFGITTIVLLFGESAPKSYAVENPESWSIRIARPLKFSEYVLYPLIVTFDVLTRIVNRFTGGRSTIETSYITRDEIRDIIKTGEREGVINQEEYEMLLRIFRFNSAIAKEAMTPRLDIDAVSTEETVDDAIALCVQAGRTRLPVHDGSLDNVFGTVEITDLVRERYYSESDDIELADVTNPTFHVPESKNADELLEEMQSERMPMVIVIDEFGTTEGLITMEDMIEEIVGDILDQDEMEPIESVDGNEVLVRGGVNIDTVNEALEVDLPEGEEFETIAGFIFNRAGRLVEQGEELEYRDVTIKIEVVHNARIKRARISRTEPPPGETDEVDLER